MTTSWQNYRNWLLGLLAQDPPDCPPPHPNAITFDSRTLTRGQWFFALQGKHHDGHDHIIEALDNGASGFFASTSWQEHSFSQRQRGVWVTDTMLALMALAKGYRQSLPVKIIAITGSVGKTTVKELLAKVLRQSHRVKASPANWNNEIGVSRSLLQLKSSDHFGIIECGARQIGDLSLLASIVRPDIALCTNIGRAHLGIFGSKKNLLQAKTELYCCSPTYCLCFANSDCPELVAAAKKTGKKIITFGYRASADVKVEEVYFSSTQEQTVVLRSCSEKFTLTSSNRHTAFPINIAAVAAVCLELGIDLNEIQSGSATSLDVPGRFQVIDRPGFTIVDDSYNANPDSMHHGLTSLSRAWPEHKKILILGDMAELGEDEVAHHRDLRPTVAAVSPVLLITVGPLARHIADNTLPTIVCDNVDDFLARKINLKDYGDLVYLKASRNVNLTPIVTSLGH